MNLRAKIYFKTIFYGTLAFILLFFSLTFSFNHAIKYGFDKTIPVNLNREGPFIALQGDSLAKIKYIFGNQKEDFEAKTQLVSQDTSLDLSVYYPPDGSEFKVALDFEIQNESAIYPAINKLFSVSDMEGNFKTFRDLLLTNQVINEALNWSFGEGHLVLLGDFVDKGFFVTQTLWLIYKLEEEAEKAGGKVHYILGNHEIDNLCRYFKSSVKKYDKITQILGIERHELYDEKSFLGRWLASKNVVEKIGPFIVAHGGLHPDFADSDLSLDQINDRIRTSFFKPFKKNKDIYPDEELLFSHKKSPPWYRGYFTENLLGQKIDDLLEKYDADQIIVGHTTLRKVSKHHDGKIIGIDVKSPQDHLKYFPFRRTEALLLEEGKWYRVNDNGLKKAF